jgi:hypothetical protein
MGSSLCWQHKGRPLVVLPALKLALVPDLKYRYKIMKALSF